MDELSTLSPAAADAAARSARCAATSTSAIADHVESAVAALGGWYGVARDGFGERVVELQAQLDTLTYTATAGAALVGEYASVLGMLKSKLATVDDEIAVVQRRVDAGMLDLSSWQSDWAELERWQASRQKVLAEFDDASEEFATRMFSVVDQVSNRPRRFGEHVDDASRTVISAAQNAAFLGAGWIWDGEGWVSTWKQVPGAAWDAATHPVDTLADAVAWDDWSEGRYGAGAATLGMAAVGRGITKGDRLGKVLPEGHRWAKYLDVDGDPLPLSIDELLAGVDLGRSEVFASAHTLARHVEVDDEFLKNRLTTGRTENDVLPSRPPRYASRWKDETIAETNIRDALRDHTSDVQWAIDTGRTTFAVRAPVSPDVGVIWTIDAAGEFVQVPVSDVVVVLDQAADGSWYVLTAYPDVPERVSE